MRYRWQNLSWSAYEIPKISEQKPLFERLLRFTPFKLANWITQKLARIVRGLHWQLARVYLQFLTLLGQRARLPPGCLTYSSLLGVSGRDFYMNKYERYGPIFKLFWPSRHLKICIVGFSKASRLLTAHSENLVPVSIDITSVVAKGFLRCMAGAEHAHYRGVFKEALRSDIVKIWDTELRQMLKTDLDELSQAPQLQPNSSNRTTDVLGRFSLKAMLALLFGVLPDNKEFETLFHAFQRLGPNGLVNPIGPAQVEAFDEVSRRIILLIRARLSKSNKVERESLLERVGVALDAGEVDPTVLGNTIFMLEMGRHDMHGLMRWLLKYLSHNQAFVTELQACGVYSKAGSRLAEACVLETLRLDQAEALNRRATADIFFDEYEIPRDSHVSILMRESHLCPESFSDPQQFNPHRFIDNRYNGDQYAPFGLKAHSCVAAGMVVKLGTMFVQELVGNFNLSVVSDGPRHRGAYHWEPSLLFEVKLCARDECADSAS
jgi:cytochrome P450